MCYRGAIAADASFATWRGQRAQFMQRATIQSRLSLSRGVDGRFSPFHSALTFRRHFFRFTAYLGGIDRRKVGSIRRAQSAASTSDRRDAVRCSLGQLSVRTVSASPISSTSSRMNRRAFLRGNDRMCARANILSVARGTPSASCGSMPRACRGHDERCVTGHGYPAILAVGAA